MLFPDLHDRALRKKCPYYITTRLALEIFFISLMPWWKYYSYSSQIFWKMSTCACEKKKNSFHISKLLIFTMSFFQSFFFLSFCYLFLNEYIFKVLITSMALCNFSYVFCYRNKERASEGINKTCNTEPFDVKAPSLELWENKEYRFIATAPRSTLNW